tara:strand:+ start:24581 stop:24754 length:174 start_codon:yes stop_codon:yes gene_type:complete
MKRMITKKVRDSFKVSAFNRIKWWARAGYGLSGGGSAKSYFESTEKQRILILRRTVK